MSKFNFVRVLKNLDRNTLLIGIAVVAIVIVGVLILTSGSSGGFFDRIKNFGGESKDDLAKKGIDYINNSVLSGQTASLVSSSEESGVIKIRISIGGSEFDSYMSRDGKLLFPEAIKMETEKTETPAVTVKSCDELTKTDKPELDAYIVSQCPFGLQMQRMIADATKNISSLAQNIKVRYIGSVSGNTITSMHGDAEAQENFKQICIREEQASKYWSYVSCYMKAGDTNGCLTSTGIDKNKLSACMTDSKRGLAFAKEDFDLANSHNVSGSPTLILDGVAVKEFDSNNQPIFGSARSSDELKTIICCASNNQPSFCSQTLNTAKAASSFSETYEGSGTGGTANCE